MIGQLKSELDTPCLCIDLDQMESNIATMAEIIIKQQGKAWRPHMKCHKTPEIAQKQIAAGAIGVTCAKVSEAEVMAAGGIHDLLIANMIVGQPKWERLASLCKSADPIVACDHFAQVEPLAKICQSMGVECRVVVEVNVGFHRVGTTPGRDTLVLAQAIDRLQGVRLVGLLGYEGHLMRGVDPEAKRWQIVTAMQTLVVCRDLLLKDGLCCDIVSAGGTGSLGITGYCEGITEIQAGGGIFADPFYRHRCGLTGLDYSLSVLATVVSRPKRDRAVLDAGRKTHYADFQLPEVKNWPDATVISVNAEHCVLELGPESQDLQIGDKVELIPGYADFTTILHDEFHGFRGNRLEVVWPITARGKLQ